jgi:hypothetical protein
MKIKLKLMILPKKIGVKASIVVTLLSLILLISSLVGSEFDYENSKSYVFFNIIIEFLWCTCYI